jgi:O-Antigen ligase
MSNASGLFRSLVVYGVCLPLAVTLGYLLANPFEFTTFTVVGLVLFALLIPIFLRFHHTWLIVTWNMSAVLFFLPGHPPLAQGLAFISFTTAVLQYTINRNLKFLNVPSVTKPLLFLAAVVLITMRLTGGIGMKSLGSETYGGKNYIAILAAIVGYYALVSRRIPPNRALLYVSLFFLGAATLAIGDLPVVLPSGFNFIYTVFPLLGSGHQALQGEDFGMHARITGLSFLGQGLFAFMLVRYGIRGIFLTSGKPWRAIAFIAIFLLGLLGGFRIILIIFIGTFTLLFFLERLHHTRLLPVLLLVALLGSTPMLIFANRLPFMMQRALSVLPINVDPEARMAAEATSEWRLAIWRNLLPQIPQYLILGKGYGFSGRELAIIGDTSRGGANQEGTELVGDYHNGPLSVLIPFGIFGMIGFLWFLWAGLQVVYQNYRFGDPAYREANAYIFASFLLKAILFFTVFGGLKGNLIEFTGMVGLSVSLNGGVAKPAVVPQPKVVFDRFKLHPSVRRPVGA